MTSPSTIHADFDLSCLETIDESTAGLYALRHRNEGILYIGLAINLRRRLKDGHKAFFWALLDCYSPFDLGIAVELLTTQSFRQGDELETRMIQIAQPRYDVRKK